MDLNAKRALVVGLGKTGLACVRFLVSRGSRVVVTDVKSPDVLKAQVDEIRALGATFVQGDPSDELAAEMDLVVVSPGVGRLASLAKAEQRGVPVISEVELAAWYYKGECVCITGTNGKSTVTTLVGDMCKALGRPLFIGGNLGTPWIEVVGTPADCKEGLSVLEVSSFQLERVRTLKPTVSCILNITPDHLDHHLNFAEYAAAKGNLFRAQSQSDYAVVPCDDPLVVPMAKASSATVKTFGGQTGTVRQKGKHLCSSVSGLQFDVSELGIAGAHNIANACAAILIAELMGVPESAIVRTLREFTGLAHRMQKVTTVRGVTFYDDSKATNVGAAVAAVEGVQQPIVLIAGGVDKGGSYSPLVTAMQKRGRGVILIGEAASLIERAFAQESKLPHERAATLQEAVQKALGLAEPGDVVLLAPACSSFDMFTSYAHRGDEFQKAVQGLASEESS